MLKKPRSGRCVTEGSCASGRGCRAARRTAIRYTMAVTADEIRRNADSLTLKPGAEIMA